MKSAAETAWRSIVDADPAGFDAGEIGEFLQSIATVRSAYDAIEVQPVRRSRALSAAGQGLTPEQARFGEHADDLVARATHLGVDAFGKECRDLARHLTAQADRDAEAGRTRTPAAGLHGQALGRPHHRSALPDPPHSVLVGAPRPDQHRQPPSALRTTPPPRPRRRVEPRARSQPGCHMGPAPTGSSTIEASRSIGARGDESHERPAPRARVLRGPGGGTSRRSHAGQRVEDCMGPGVHRHLVRRLLDRSRRLPRTGLAFVSDSPVEVDANYDCMVEAGAHSHLAPRTPCGISGTPRSTTRMATASTCSRRSTRAERCAGAAT